VSAGSGWDDWLPTSPTFYGSELENNFLKEATFVLAREFGEEPLILIKDPRICRILPFWKKLFGAIDYDLKIVIPVRSPAEVALSLRNRDGFPLHKGLLLWLRHVLDAEADSRDTIRAIVPWDLLVSNWRSTVVRIQNALGLNEIGFGAETQEIIDSFISEKLRHHLVPDSDISNYSGTLIWVNQTYSAMKRLMENPKSVAARRSLDRIKLRFDNAAKIFGDTIREFEKNEQRARADAISARAEHEILWTEAAREKKRAEELAIKLEQLAERGSKMN
jgi:hypothetical protein